jgi:hypothetical protein
VEKLVGPPGVLLRAPAARRKQHDARSGSRISSRYGAVADLRRRLLGQLIAVSIASV